MPKEMLINVSEGEECRIALVEDGRLEELYMERSSSTSHVGNIYKGKVTNVEPSIQAAFIDFGLGRNGFLHITDLMPTYFGRKGEDIQETVGRKMSRRDRPPIQRCLRRGDEIIVQIIKEGIGTKGPTLSSYLSIPGRILVMMPGMSRLGVSKKIEDDAERRRLRQILDGCKPPKDVGFIIRTAGVGKTKLEIQRDFTYLSRMWMQIEKKLASGPGPMELYTEGDLVTRTVRDIFSADVDRIIVDNEAVARRVNDVIKITAPRAKNRVELYTDPVPLFHKYGIEKDIELMHSRHVPLPSGGSLVIDSTEAIVAIDVNSGKFREHADAETTAFKTDMEAAEEIPRQLRLRDLGGVIICDFIDLRYERHRRELEETLNEKFKNDRAKTKVLPMSQFGIIEMTRQRMRPSLKRSIYFDCPHCKGSGLVKTPESMSLDVMRRLAIAAHDQRVVRVELSVCPEAAFYLQNRKRGQLADLEDQTRKPIVIKADAALGLDELKLNLFDSRDGAVYIAELGMLPAEGLPGAGRRQGGRPDRNQQRGRGGRPPEPARRREAAPLEDAFDLDSGEEAVDEREETMEDGSASLAPPPKPVQRSERPESYSNFTDNDVDMGDEEEEEQFQRGRQPQSQNDGRAAEPTGLPVNEHAENGEQGEDEAESRDPEAEGEFDDGEHDEQDEHDEPADDESGDALAGDEEPRGGVLPWEEPRRDQGRGQGRDQGRGQAQNRDQGRRGQGRNEQGRNDQGRNDQGRNDQGRQDQGRNDQGRQDQGRRGEPPRDESRRDQRGGDQRGDQRPDPRRGQPQGQRPPQQASRPQPPGNRPPVSPGNRPPLQQGPGHRGPQQVNPRPPQGGPPPGGPQQGRPPQGRPPQLPPGVAPVGGPEDEQGEFGGEGGEGDGTRRRRRRRRGGRGRNRNRDRADQPGQEGGQGGGVPAATPNFDDYNADDDDRDQNDRAEPAQEGREDNRHDQGEARKPLVTDFTDRDDRGSNAPADDRDHGRADENRQDGSHEFVAREERDQNKFAREEIREADHAPSSDQPVVSERMEELQPASEQQATADPSVSEAATEATEDEAPAKKGRSRGGRGRGGAGRGGKKPAKEAAAPAAEAAEPPAEAKPAKGRRGTKAPAAPKKPRGKGRAQPPAEEPAASASPIVEPTIRTGSSDRHHLIVDEVADEPVHRPEPRRPRTYRDLDEIPDDLD